MTDAADVDFAAATKALAARERILQALGPLAASPLDEDATTRMSQALRQASKIGRAHV